MVATTTPFISYLVTAYQTEKYVGETIRSVLTQTRSDWELVVVDNGNSDEMAAVVGNFTSDPRIKLIRQENKGVRGASPPPPMPPRGATFAYWTATTCCRPPSPSA